MNNKERQDLVDLPVKIAKLEEEQSDLTAQLADPELYKDGPLKASQIQKRLQEIESQHSQALSRWLELESRS
jgi:ATP-binding cassette subfamily F protein uup